ncbi:hypothetical protein PPERSA_10886 [Pseudocohnilembus persalinus]|uniref:RanBP2-type domain-containing protein n=1 Tax=Pseudocohnilembus persalinus TaxID=266149 RepID=A0A0V0R9E5_PSEPJ|nr:hypothetical protein PPERSA_10886 [Pseudocohnilembus persalinus]|eukprot:KRX11119.1 hypothetical protein PPERSA_10886 [Pseudocohnilembus persalinus]
MTEQEQIQSQMKGQKQINPKNNKKNNPVNQYRAGDWICLICNNLNFSFRNQCNRCKIQSKKNNYVQNLMMINEQSENYQQYVPSQQVPEYPSLLSEQNQQYQKQNNHNNANGCNNFCKDGFNPFQQKQINEDPFQFGNFQQGYSTYFPYQQFEKETENKNHTYISEDTDSDKKKKMNKFNFFSQDFNFQQEFEKQNNQYADPEPQNNQIQQDQIYQLFTKKPSDIEIKSKHENDSDKENDQQSSYNNTEKKSKNQNQENFTHFFEQPTVKKGESETGKGSISKNFIGSAISFDEIQEKINNLHIENQEKI